VGRGSLSGEVTETYTVDLEVADEVMVVVKGQDEDSAMTEAARPARTMADLIMLEKL
jgi:hypothetical protein